VLRWRRQSSALAWIVHIGSAMLDTHRIFEKEAFSAMLSLIVPGVGQVYNGDFARGAFWLIVTPGFWLGSGGTLGWACHLTSAFTAHRRAARRMRTTVVA